MSSDWVPFTDLLSAIVDNRGRTCPVGAAGIPLIATNCIDSSNLYPRYETTRFVSDETYRTWFRGHPQPGDILFVCKGSPGRTNWVPEKVDFCIAQDMVSVRADPNKIYPKYLFAALRSSVVQVQIDNMNVGTMIPHFKKGDFGKLNIPVPSSDIQRLIGDFYFSISEQIALLREINETLEAIAQAIFKSWFVDFDPVKAKAAGLAPGGIDEVTAALFPDSFEKSALGLVPEGWSTTTLADHVTADRGLSYKGSGLCGAEDGIPMHNLNSVLEGGGYKYAGLKFYKGDYKDRHLISAGEIIVANTEQGHDHKLIGFPALVPECYPKGILSHHLYRVRIREESCLTRQFIFHMLMTNAVREQIISCANGSTVNMLKSAGLEIPKFPCPPIEILNAFDAIATLIRSSIEANVEEIKTLAELRDTLLPRLISGKLWLPETIQEAVEMA
ncbi:HsdS Restriction endonuclease S subunits [Comamonadaceae bacterium]